MGFAFFLRACRASRNRTRIIWATDLSSFSAMAASSARSAGSSRSPVVAEYFPAGLFMRESVARKDVDNNMLNAHNCITMKHNIRENRGATLTRWSTPCPYCGRVDNLETVIPTGIHMDRQVAWQCRCKNVRTIEITPLTPQALIRKAMARDEAVRDDKWARGR